MAPKGLAPKSSGLGGPGQREATRLEQLLESSSNSAKQRAGGLRRSGSKGVRPKAESSDKTTGKRLRESISDDVGKVGIRKRYLSITERKRNEQAD